MLLAPIGDPVMGFIIILIIGRTGAAGVALGLGFGGGLSSLESLR